MRLPPKVVPITLGYIATVLAFFLLDNFAEIARGNSFLERISRPAYWYQRAVTSGFKKPRNNFVALVLIDDKVPEGIKSNYCRQRRYVADLVRRLRDATPAVLALDLTFGLEACPETTDLYQGTVELKSAISDVSKTVPIVVAQKTIDASTLAEESPKKLGDLKARGFKDSEVIIASSVEFNVADGKVSYGLYTFNEDLRKIPLSWAAYTSSDAVGRESPSMTDTFSVAVAKAYYPDQRVLSEIERFQAEQKHPLTSFLTEPEIRCFSASDILAGFRHSSSGLERCASTDTKTDVAMQLNHRVVIIGKDAPDDRHDSIIGVVPGAVLQANYIESILDSRLLRSVQGWLSVAVALAWLGLIEFVFRRLAEHPHRALGLAILATVVVWIVLYDLVVMQWGYYLVLWPPSVIAILWRYVLVVSESARKPKRIASPELEQIPVKEASVK